MTSKPYLEPYQSCRTHVLALCVLLGIGMLLDLAGVAVELSQASLLSAMAAGQKFANADLEANDARVQLVGIFTMIVYVATVIVFLIWIHRAHKNLAAFDTAGLEYSPGWAVGGFFVPFLNLIRPFQVMREIWKASDPDVDYDNANSWQYSSTSPLLAAWWGTWIVSNILGRLVFSFSKDAKSIEALLNLTYLSIASDVVNLIPAALVIIIVRSIERRQQQKYERLTVYWAHQAAQLAQGAAEPTDPGSL
jgi:hypothetical protein